MEMTSLSLDIMIALLYYRYLFHQTKYFKKVKLKCRFLFHFDTLNLSLFRSIKTKPPWNMLFYGTDEFSVENLKSLNANRITGNPPVVEELGVVTAPKTKGTTLIRKYASNNGLQVFDWPYIIPENKYDVGVVASFGHLIPSKTIASFRWGMLNVHASLLPRWRGAAPIVHCIYHGDKETGVTIMQIEPKHFDVGKILLQEVYRLPENITTKQLTSTLSKLGGELLLKALQDLPELNENGKFQDLSLVTLAPKIKPQFAIVDWEAKTCIDIDRHYRALPENMKLQTFWNGQTVKLLEMVPLKVTNEINITPTTSSSNNVVVNAGHIFYHKKEKILCIKCKDGWVGFRHISLSGFKPMSALDFKNGFLSKANSPQVFSNN